MKSKFLILTLLLTISFCIRQSDKVNSPPGMSSDTIIYSGFLNTLQQNRKLHYVFVQSQQNPSEAPLTIWLNGGPGCSSLIGFLQEVGPYTVGNTYTHGDNLTKNEHRWNKASNMLFIQSPGIVGFSTDTDHQFQYSDHQTADDAFFAIKDFLFNVAPEFSNRQLFISGQSYAGKYIPDLTVRILNHNRQDNATYINLKGILIGNGVMNFKDESLTKSSIQFMIEHDFFSERLLLVYKSSCDIDFHSPRCQYFKYQFSVLRRDLNHYNVYEVCQTTHRSIQQIRLQEFIRQLQDKMLKFESNPEKYKNETYIQLKQINQCPSDQGMIDYLNMYKAAYNVFNVSKNWTVCADLKYTKTEEGSMEEYQQIFLNKGVKVWLFNGDWDDVVPFPDTEKNLHLLKRKKTGNLQPWFIGQHHAGFYQVYDSLTLITVKAASHMVPQSKPQASYQMFYNFIKDRPINTPV